MKIYKDTEMLHPILTKQVKKIQIEIIDPYNMPIKLFETGRTHDRHETLINRGRTKDLISGHLYNLENDPPLYASAIDYVFYDGRWSWNLRDSTIHAWYTLFGNLVLDTCPELEWFGMNRKSVNLCHFILKGKIMQENLDIIPCVV